MLTLLALCVSFAACSTVVKYKSPKNSKCVLAVGDTTVDVEYILKEGGKTNDPLDVKKTYGKTTFKYSKSNGYFFVIVSDDGEGHIKPISGTINDKETQIKLYGWEYNKQ